VLLKPLVAIPYSQVGHTVPTSSKQNTDLPSQHTCIDLLHNPAILLKQVFHILYDFIGASFTRVLSRLCSYGCPGLFAME